MLPRRLVKASLGCHDHMIAALPLAPSSNILHMMLQCFGRWLKRYVATSTFNCSRMHHLSRSNRDSSLQFSILSDHLCPTVVQGPFVKSTGIHVVAALHLHIGSPVSNDGNNPCTQVYHKRGWGPHLCGPKQSCDVLYNQISTRWDCTHLSPLLRIAAGTYRRFAPKHYIPRPLSCQEQEYDNSRLQDSSHSYNSVICHGSSIQSFLNACKHGRWLAYKWHQTGVLKRFLLSDHLI